MMSKLMTQSNNQGMPFKPKIYKEKGEAKEGIFVMTQVGSKGEIGQVVETDSEGQSPYRGRLH